MDDKKKKNNLDGVIPSQWMKNLGDKPSSGSKLSPNDRVEMIKKVFQEILCREPDTRDLNYYKYSSMDEESIRGDLLEGEEHKSLVKDGREYKKIKNLLDEAKSKIKVLEGQVEDREDNVRQMEELLSEKNLHIEELKKNIESQFQAN